MEFTISFKVNFLAVLQIFILGLAGFYILKKGMQCECCLNMLTNLVIDITLPCFIFSSIIMNFPDIKNTEWYLMPIAFFGMLFLSILISIIYFKIDKSLLEKKEFIGLVCFQNVGFLPIVIVNSLFPAKVAGQLNVYIFLFVMFFNPVFFSIAETLYSNNKKIKFEIRQLLNPVFIITIFSLIIVLLGIEKDIPDFIVKPISLIGHSTIPISMIVIGGTIVVNFQTKQKFNFPFIFKVSIFKLIIIPLVVIFLIKNFQIPEIIKFIIILEAIVPPAVNNLLLARKFDGSYTVIGHAVLITHILSLITIPLFLTYFIDYRLF